MEWELDVQPIGTVRSCFLCKNGTPRQPTIASSARGQLKISKGIYNNPEHALEGLQEFSHVWIIFVFHKNKCGRFAKAKVSPPRLNGGRMGVFATRSPYRLNPIGLSLVKLESVQGDTLHFSGHDLVDGTPVLDIKPYIREYDSPDSRGCDTSPERPQSRASSPGRPAEDPLPTEVPQPRPGTSSDPAGVPQSPIPEGASRLNDDRLEPPSHSDDAGRLQEDPDSVIEVGTEESQSPRSSGPQAAEKQTAVRSPEPSKSQPVDSFQERCTVNTPASDPHVVCATSAGDPPIHPAPSSDREDGDTWLSRLRPEQWTVSFTAWAESQLARFSASASAGRHRLRLLRSSGELRTSLQQLLTADPRSVYRRARNDQLLYHLALDASHVTCWFDSARRVIEVLRVQPLADSPLAGVAAQVGEESGAGEEPGGCVSRLA